MAQIVSAMRFDGSLHIDRVSCGSRDTCMYNDTCVHVCWLKTVTVGILSWIGIQVHLEFHTSVPCSWLDGIERDRVAHIHEVVFRICTVPDQSVLNVVATHLNRLSCLQHIVLESFDIRPDDLDLDLLAWKRLRDKVTWRYAHLDSELPVYRRLLVKKWTTSQGPKSPLWCLPRYEVDRDVW